MYTTELTYRDYAYLKKLGNSYKLIKCNEVRKKGYEKCDLKINTDSFDVGVGRNKKRVFVKEMSIDFTTENEVIGKINESDGEKKLMNNISRARNKILEYVLCNDFVFFVTLTLSPEKYDRENLPQFIKHLSKFINNYNSRKNANIQYVLIPEQHEDGAWHLHGFIMGLPYDRLELLKVDGDRKLPYKILNKLKDGQLVYTFPEYEKRFGYNLFEPIRNKKASALYMSKYLTKDISRNVKELGNHLYYCSKGLKKAEIVKQGQFLDSEFEFEFSNQYCGSSFYDILSESELEDLKSKIGSKPISIDEYRKGYRKKDGWLHFIDTDTGEIIGYGYKENEVFG